MDIRKTVFYPATVPFALRRARPESVDPKAAQASEGPARNPNQDRPRAVESAPHLAEGRTRYRAGDDTARVERQTALNARSQQALQAYLSHENIAQQESQAALNQALGVDYYA